MPIARPSITATSAGTSHQFITLKGDCQGIGSELVDISRPGVDGHAYRRVGKHGRPFQLDGHRDCQDNADAGSLYEAMVAAYRGQTVTVVDDLGRTQPNLVCLEVDRVESRRLLKAVGGITTSMGAMLVVRFTLQRYA